MSLQAHWKLTEGTGAAAHDTAGGAHDGAITGCTWVRGRIGNGLHYIAGNHVDVPHHAALNPTTAMTACAWVKADSWTAGNYNALIWKNGSFRFGVHDTSPYFGGPPGCITFSLEAVPVGKWSHVTVVYDSTLGGYMAGLADCSTFKDLGQVVALGAAGKWDNGGIREIGNVLYDPDEVDPDRRFKITYSGYLGAYAQNNVYIGCAFSPTGEVWTKYTVDAPLIARSLEDPYVVKVAGVYYLFVEDKGDGAYVNIRRYHSADFTTWTDDGVVFQPQAGGVPVDWEITDVSSPAVWVEDGVWHLFYEGRHLPAQQGRIGHATSTDGLTWTRVGAGPIMLPESWRWDYTEQVTDDIVKVDGVYYLTYHGFGALSALVFDAMLTSTDLMGWTRHREGTLDYVNTMMLLPLPGSEETEVYGFGAPNATSGIKRYQAWVKSAPRFYINGLRISQDQSGVDYANAPLAAGVNNLGLGCYVVGPAYVFLGTLNDLRLYNTAFSDSQVYSLYRSTLPGVIASGLLGLSGVGEIGGGNGLGDMEGDNVPADPVRRYAVP